MRRYGWFRTRQRKSQKFGQLAKWYDFTDPNGGESGQSFGTVQITGVYMTPASSYPLQEFFMRNVAVKHGQAPVIHLMPKIYEMIQKEEIDPTPIITHTMPLEEAAAAYDIFDKKKITTSKWY